MASHCTWSKECLILTQQDSSPQGSSTSLASLLPVLLCFPAIFLFLRHSKLAPTPLPSLWLSCLGYSPPCHHVTWSFLDPQVSICFLRETFSLLMNSKISSRHSLFYFLQSPFYYLSNLVIFLFACCLSLPIWLEAWHEKGACQFSCMSPVPRKGPVRSRSLISICCVTD